ncbi:MAG TPA: response regulator [Thermoanaerobaculia bacterium]|jgi:diguanylate cyclase (GGDEF)-like protein
MSALSERRKAPSRSSFPVRLLIVDDDPTYLGYAAALTRRIGFSVETASDGEAAVACLTGGSFDVVIIDQEMPRLSGIETIGRLRGNDETRSLYAVMLTGHEDAETKLTALDAGFDDFLSKAAPESEIVAKLVAAQRVGARQSSMNGELRALQGLASRDDLTGLFNRRFFSTETEQLIAAGGAVNVLILDLDGFKEVNDARGHLVGDAVLRDVAIALQRHTRPDDIVARLGGDEFVIAVPGVEPEVVETIAARLTAAIAALEWQDGGTFQISASAGFACSSLLPDATLARLLETADHDMYKEKWLRKNPERRPGEARMLQADPGEMRAGRILVAEDDRVIRNLLKLIAQRCGEVVDVAPDGAEALALLQRNRYDVLLLDLMMPEMNGYEIIQHLRTFTERPAVIVVTAMSGDRFLELDADVVTAVVHKPFDVDSLADTVSHVANEMASARIRKDVPATIPIASDGAPPARKSGHTIPITPAEGMRTLRRS